MTIIIQTITTIWTKKSRGAPAAAVRAATPDACALPDVACPVPVLLHAVRFLERIDFQPEPACWEPAEQPNPRRSHALEPGQGWVTTDGLPMITRGMRVAFDGALVTVARLPEEIPGWPDRQQGPLLSVKPSTWARLIWNRRHAGGAGGHGEWTYAKVVLNVANQLDPRDHPFFGIAPQRVLDQSADLA